MASVSGRQEKVFLPTQTIKSAESLSLKSIAHRMVATKWTPSGE